MAKDPVSENIRGVSQLVSSNMNKTSGNAGMASEGAESERLDPLSLDLDDDQLLMRAKSIEARYETYYQKRVKTVQEAQRTYYLGRQKTGTSTDMDAPVADNMLFEAEETFLPAALAKNPEPVVYADNTPEGTQLARDIKTMLQYHADTLVLRRKLGRMTRLWSVDLIGVMKHGWDDQIGDIKSEVRQGRNFVFDPEGYVDEYGDFVGDLGERINSRTALELAEMFPDHADYITVMVDGRMGTKVTYTEWWSDDFCYYTFRDRVLDKHKNPHFSYAVTEQEEDEDGMIQEVESQGFNHFGRPKKPYTFLSVFTFGEQPHDVTGLIEQNIPNQNKINRRDDQIDYNLSKSNNSDVFSAENFTEQTARQAANALRDGNPVLVPSGKPISEAIHRLQTPGIPADYFNDLNMRKQTLRSSFGTEGISSQPQDDDQTVRGLILNQSHDSSRIGGGIGESLEQFADNVFNWWLQLYCVYYDQDHFGVVMGQMRAAEYVTLRNTQIDRRIVVSVSPNSMKPRDEITEMNEAQALYDKGAIDPKTLLTVLNFPDPQQTAEQAVLWKVDPTMYMQLNFPELWARMQQASMQNMGMMTPGGAPQPLPGEPIAPEDITEPTDDSLASDPASAALSNVSLPPI